jgi:hypothetical protein
MTRSAAVRDAKENVTDDSEKGVGVGPKITVGFDDVSFSTTCRAS